MTNDINEKQNAFWVGYYQGKNTYNPFYYDEELTKEFNRGVEAAERDLKDETSNTFPSSC